MSTKARSRISGALRNGAMPAFLQSVAVSIEYVTPEDAEIYLEMNRKNYRKLNARLVDKYAADMQAKMWKFDGTPICFTEDDVLADGQHRLSAIAKSKIAQWCLVVRNLPSGSETSPTKDTGKKRMASDHIAFAGHKYPVVIAAAIRFLHKLHCKIEKSEETVLSDSMIIRLQEMFVGLEQCAAMADSAVGSRAVFAAFAFLAMKEDDELTFNCMDIVCGRVESSTFHPFAKLRQMFTESSRASSVSRQHVDQMSQFDLTLSAWHHVKSGNLSVKILRTSANKLSPKMEKVLREFHV